MRVVMITENDPAGMGIAFCNAINRYTDHQCRLITTEIRYNFMFEKDLHLPFLSEDDFDEVRDELENADILHFHMLSDENVTLGNLKVSDFVKGKKIVHHHHGHPEFRSNPLKFHEKYKKLNRKKFVSTPDLLELLPDSVWVPNIVPINDPLFMPMERINDDKVRICQAPTRKDLKNTDIFIDVMDSLMLRNSNLEYQVIENTLYSECLSQKQEFDIHFDHMQGYFGVSSIESLSQGKSVVAGLNDWNQQCIKEFAGVEKLPWIIARNKEEFFFNVDLLIKDKVFRQSVGEYSRIFMEKYWTESHSLSILIRQYEGL